MKKNIGIIGGGKLGTCLAKKLKYKKLLTGITASTKERSEKLAKIFQIPSMDNNSLIKNSSIILLTVPDRLINEIAVSLSKNNLHLDGKTFLHCSGAMGVAALKPLKEKGANIGSLHPLQTFANMDTSLKDVYMAIDGDSEAQKNAYELAETLEGVPFHVPSEERALYHATACICSNYAVAIEYIAQELMSRWMPYNDKEAGWSALKPMFRATANNLLNSNLAERPLTGPISRGDKNTIEKHLKQLPPELFTLYRELGITSLKAALSNKTINKETAQEIENILK